MPFGTLITAVAMLQASAGNAEAVDVAFEEMVAQENTAAIERIEASNALDADDPAQLINLGIAYAREGRIVEARAALQAAAKAETRYRLETASGDWVDSRWLAKKALAMLDQGQLTEGRRFASR
ncbi:hypothetical protein [Pontixanthobacter aquaemixtae]|uniref:Uncharacterized protein n=1 Tax=Pontixanthobacter aquaemixtae TaxID=1958940 RepID=A0A844ZRM2_9SPHN|nr:hypothetical protein [Pontixanthobacter aquaemixtae]MXO90971.1 hypothetical protein [Pontixanthobacter aquaemixtae]